VENKLNMGNVQDYIVLQIALKRGYFMLTAVKPIKHSKEKSVVFFKTILRISKYKKMAFLT